MSIVSQVLGGVTNSLGFGQRPTNVTPTPVDKNYEGLVKQQSNLANQYTKNLPSTQGQLANVAQDQARSQLAQGYQAADRYSNSRGLLYGGLGAGNRAGVENQIAGNLSNQLQQNNLNTTNQANNMQNAALQSGINLQQMQQQSYNQAYNQALANRQQALGQQNGLLGGIASLGGMVLGGGLGDPFSSSGDGNATQGDPSDTVGLTSTNASYHYGGV